MTNDIYSEFIERRPSNSSVSLEDFKSIVLPYELRNLEVLNLTDEEIESKRRIARRDFNDAKFQEYEKFLVKFKKGSSLKDRQIGAV